MSARKYRYGAEYDPAALRLAMEQRGVSVNEMAILCAVARGAVKSWLDPEPGRRMHWITMNRIRAALELSEAEVRGIWKV